NVVEGSRVLLVEDMTTDGRSKVNFCNALRQAGCTVEHCFVVFFYDIFPEGRKILKDLNVELHALATWWDVLAAAKETGKFEPARAGGGGGFRARPASLVQGPWRRRRSDGVGTAPIKAK